MVAARLCCLSSVYNSVRIFPGQGYFSHPCNKAHFNAKAEEILYRTSNRESGPKKIEIILSGFHMKVVQCTLPVRLDTVPWRCLLSVVNSSTLLLWVRSSLDFCCSAKLADLIWPVDMSFKLTLWRHVRECDVMWGSVTSCEGVWRHVRECDAMWGSVTSHEGLWRHMRDCDVTW
jgi:hypothetical protein